MEAYEINLGHDVDIAKGGITYREKPEHPYTVVDDKLVEDPHMVTLYILKHDENGETSLAEMKGVIVFTYSNGDVREAAQFVPALFIRHMATTNTAGHYLTESPLDEYGKVIPDICYPVYRKDDNGNNQYYGLGRGVNPHPGEIGWGAIWTDWSVTREEVIMTFLAEEERYLLDGHRPQHIIEQNIDALGRALNKFPVPPYIPTIPAKS